MNEPVSLVEARDQSEVWPDDTAHNTKLNRFITAAREQVETDTSYVSISQTFTLSLRTFPPNLRSIEIPVRPVQSISSLTYFDGDNAQQTLATTVYGLDAARRLVFLKYDKTWPSIAEQHDGIVITLIAGFGLTEANVPRLIKQAMLLQITKWFEHRGEEMGMSPHDVAYDRIIRRILRTSYP